MKTFLKVLLIILAVLVGIKLLPLTLLVGCALGAAALVTLVVGASAAVTILVVALAALALLSPIWLPVLAVVGLVALIRRSRKVQV